MIIKSAAENMPVMSNVGETGEFRIRNSAKAFSILSSGLYANKIRAIVREYSCNAWDSHVMAGCEHLPFDVHLPSQFEPWFAVRDYGVGLSHEGVVEIFTTYFESTKTSSNDVIGGLGLGSKAAFSYTDNFTVVAVRDGRRGVYTAYINEGGVPSIALMMEEETEDPNGVEIKFSVNDRDDFYKFAAEARAVYQYFPVVPSVTGVSTFEVIPVEYRERDIAPGVNQLMHSRGGSIAVMGNIAYPLVVPNEEANLGDLRTLLQCGLEIQFGIGDLDIQASREGLSYIPSTIEAVKLRLEEIAAHLALGIAERLDEVENPWEKALAIGELSGNPLMRAPVAAYLALNPNDMVTAGYRGHHAISRGIATRLLEEWNIQITGRRVGGYSTSRVLKADSSVQTDDGSWEPAWSIPVTRHTRFFVRDIRGSARSRLQHHYSTDADIQNQQHYCYVVEPLDRKLPMNTAALFDHLRNPPKVTEISTLADGAKTPSAARQPTPILRLEQRTPGRSYRARDTDLVWRDAGVLSSFDTTTTYLYVAVKGFVAVSDRPITDIARWASESGIPGLRDLVVYGVRKADLATVAALPNWQDFETFVVEKINEVTDEVIRRMAASTLDNRRTLYHRDEIIKLLPPTSPFVVSSQAADSRDRIRYGENAIARLTAVFGSEVTRNQIVEEIGNEARRLTTSMDRYPLLSELSNYANPVRVADYIRLIDELEEKNKD